MKLLETTVPPRDERWDEERLRTVREREVLTQWPDVGHIDLDEGIEYHRRLPPEKVAAHVVESADRDGRILVQHRHGLSLIDDHIRDLQYLEDVGGTDISSTQSDAYTRQLQFQRAAEALESSRQRGRSLTVGIPAHLYGVQGVRRITESLERPSAIRMASSDARLSKEIYLAAGFTYVLMGTMQNLSYEKDATLASMIEHYQYEDRLISLYEEAGAPIVKETTATLTGTLVPPSIAIACSIIDALIAATQGVRRIMLSYGSVGNLFQDVAAIHSLRKLGREWLDRSGHSGTAVYVVTSQWMADFPQDRDQAYGVIAYGSAAAALGGSDMVLTKSLDEAFGVPTKESNAAGLRVTRQILRILTGQHLAIDDQVGREAEMIEAEVSSILTAVMELGEGDVAVGACRALDAGIIDVPFSPSRYNAGKVLPVRDTAGAVRFGKWGNVPLPPASVEYNRQRLESRLDVEPQRPLYELMVDDIFGMSKPLA